MATSVMSSLALKPAPFLGRPQAKGLPSLVRPSSSFKVQASGKKLKTDKPYGTTGLLIWAVTLAGLLAGGALLVYNTSALAQ
ncbi:hypothetical protein B296_00025709 [Ensete ventricosum]|uniref:Photosystem II 10 kDa polypeptide, chloroplastic n=1 Tax=Ensete ventricosum TaxID=4639 RepID=A0A427AQZ1_ENSVE|nr:hypothetical protein B296_00025709 [Ensete ventricosum]